MKLQRTFYKIYKYNYYMRKASFAHTRVLGHTVCLTRHPGTSYQFDAETLGTLLQLRTLSCVSGPLM